MDVPCGHAGQVHTVWIVSSEKWQEQSREQSRENSSTEGVTTLGEFEDLHLCCISLLHLSVACMQPQLQVANTTFNSKPPSPNSLSAHGLRGTG